MKKSLQLPKDKARSFKGELLDGYDKGRLERIGATGRTKLRRLRYWCYRIQKAEGQEISVEDCPVGLKDFVEGLPGFLPWERFAITWDVHGEDPFMVIGRLTSPTQEWEMVMERVTIPIDASPEEARLRMKMLIGDFQKRNK